MRISDWSSDVCSSDLSPPLCGIFDSGRSIGLPPDWPRLHALRHPPARFEEVRPQPNLPFPQNCRVNENSLPRHIRHKQLHSAQSADHYVLLLGIGRQPVPSHFGLMAKRSEEHTSELQSLMRKSYAVFCL